MNSYIIQQLFCFKTSQFKRDILMKKLLKLSLYVIDLVLTKVRQHFLNF
jgi:hypothetical protein